MTRATWSKQAEQQLESYLDYLAERDSELPRRARSDIHGIADQTARRPGLARPARWTGLHERSVRPWRKLLVIAVTGGAVRVIAFYDQRQDLAAVYPLSE